MRYGIKCIYTGPTPIQELNTHNYEAWEQTYRGKEAWYKGINADIGSIFLFDVNAVYQKLNSLGSVMLNASNTEYCVEEVSE